MTAFLRRLGFWLPVAVVAGGALPVALFWWFVGRAPTVEPDQARAWLAAADGRTRAVDVRPAAAFAAGHLPGAVSLPWASIRTLAGPDLLPAELRGRRLIVVCNSGLQAAPATLRLRETAGAEAYDLAGGITAWNATAGETGSRPLRSVPPAEQWLVVLSAFGVKPAYMLLSLVLIVWLRRQRSPDLVALRWGLVIFLAGETACAVNYQLLGGTSALWDHFHNYGMAAGFSFIAFALLEGADRRLIKYSGAQDRCAALSLCRACVKYEAVPCGLRRVFHFLLAALMIVALIPLAAGPHFIAYDLGILGSRVTYTEPLASQLFEIRYCPWVSLLLLGASWFVLATRRDDPVGPAKKLLAAAVDPLGFGLMRLFLFAVFRDDLVWFTVWEEVTELLFVAGTGAVLLIFRDSLFRAPRADGAGAPVPLHPAPAAGR